MKKLTQLTKLMVLFGLGYLVGQVIFITYHSTEYWNECNRVQKLQYKAEVLKEIQDALKSS